MGKRRLNKVKSCFERDVKEISVLPSTVVCSGCGCVLTKDNKSFDSCLCKTCFDVDMAELEAEDIEEDSMAVAELSDKACALCQCSLGFGNRSEVRNLCLNCFDNLKF